MLFVLKYCEIEPIYQTTKIMSFLTKETNSIKIELWDFEQQSIYFK